MPATITVSNDETQTIDIGDSAGVTITNLSAVNVEIFVDYQQENGTWTSVNGNATLAPGATWAKTRVEIGHDHIRIGARAPELADGVPMLRVVY